MSFSRYEHERCTGIARALKACKQFLRTGEELGTIVRVPSETQVHLFGAEKEFHICFALKTAMENRKISIGEADDAVQHVMKMLDGHFSVDTWVKRNVQGAALYEGTVELKKELQEFRHRWVDAMIVEFSDSKKWIF